MMFKKNQEHILRRIQWVGSGLYYSIIDLFIIRLHYNYDNNTDNNTDYNNSNLNHKNMDRSSMDRGFAEVDIAVIGMVVILVMR